MEDPRETSIINFVAAGNINTRTLDERADWEAPRASRLDHIHREGLISRMLLDICIQVIALYIFFSFITEISCSVSRENHRLLPIVNIQLIPLPFPTVLAFSINCHAPSCTTLNPATSEDGDIHIFHRIVLRLETTSRETRADSNVFPISIAIRNEYQRRIRHGSSNAETNPGLAASARHVEEKVIAVVIRDINSESEVNAIAYSIVDEDGGGDVCSECGGRENC
jgi:hypothetical protein